MPMPFTRIGIRTKTQLSTVLLAMGILLPALNAAAADGPPQSADWVQTHLLGNPATLPFSFVYGLKFFDSLLKKWQEKNEKQQLDPDRVQRKLMWTDPETGLEVRLVAVQFVNSPVVEW